MKDTNSYVIRELSPELLRDYLSFFDHEAFADNPRWASCYCYFNHAPHHLKDWEERSGPENRAAVSQMIRSRQMHGYLAYLDGRPVAWCNAGPRTHVTTLQEAEEPNADQIGSIVCFVVAKPYRGQGIARRLLQAACEGFRRQGFKIAEAYPRKEAQDEATNYHGPLSMYLAAGFQPFREADGVVVVRQTLSAEEGAWP